MREVAVALSPVIAALYAEAALASGRVTTKEHPVLRAARGSCDGSWETPTVQTLVFPAQQTLWQRRAEGAFRKKNSCRQ